MAKRERKFEYDVENGHLNFICDEWQGTYYKKFTGFVPDDIVNLGDKEIRKYVKAEVEKQKKAEQRKLNKRYKKIKATNFPLEVFHGNIHLRGKIIDYSPKGGRGGIEILLKEPKEYKGEDLIISCFGLAMSGFRFFDDDGNLTKEAIERAKMSLIEIYEEKNKEILKQKSAPVAYEAAKRLNKKNKG